ncbi:MAG: nicotinamide riboside transporter PnuC [Bacteroidetes bacterium]|nr:nicotinamide riboside transporter PnuC [Bacteroidota bacterium]
MNDLELIAALLGVWSVWLVVKRKWWAFPIGILMVVLYTYVFFEARLYSDMLLQILFIGLQIQGWYAWSKGERATDSGIKVRVLKRWQWAIGLAGFLVMGATLGWAMQQYTNAALPWLDAFTTAASVLAQLWMNFKYLENWYLWIAVDVVYLYQYSARGLYFTTGLYFIFCWMAIYGLHAWRAQYKDSES